MSKIDDLNTQPKYDNALQVARTASIPSNEKYTASEWNALISKTNEVVGRANLNTWDIVANYSELPTDPVNGQKVYVTGSGLTGHVSVQMMVNGKSSRGFYVYDAFSDLWVQKTSESEGGELKKIGDGYGLQHQVDNPTYYGTLGTNAVNFTYSNEAGDFGATGDASHAEGYKATAPGYVSKASGFNTMATGSYSNAEGNYTTAGSFAENARGLFNEIITPISKTTFNANDVIESVGVGTNLANRKNALTRWKNGAFKWLLQPLTNITNAVIGFHAADEDGRLNYHNGTEWKKYLIEGEDYNGVTPTVTASVITDYDIDIATQTEHWNLTMTGDTDFDFTNMFASGNSKVITITLKGNYAFTFPSWLKPLETNDDYDTIGGTLAAEIVINIKNGGATPSGYYSLQMIDYAL